MRTPGRPCPFALALAAVLAAAARAAAQAAPGRTPNPGDAWTADPTTVTPDGHSAWSEWQASGKDETFEVVLEAAGRYQYYCSPHRSPGMTGRIIVE